MAHCAHIQGTPLSTEDLYIMTPNSGTGSCYWSLPFYGPSCLQCLTGGVEEYGTRVPWLDYGHMMCQHHPSCACFSLPHCILLTPSQTQSNQSNVYYNQLVLVSFHRNCHLRRFLNVSNALTLISSQKYLYLSVKWLSDSAMWGTSVVQPPWGVRVFISGLYVWQYETSPVLKVWETYPILALVIANTFCFCCL